MIGEVYLIDTINKKKQIYRYDSLSGDPEMRKKLYFVLKKNAHLKLICGCSDEKALEIKINNNYHLYRAQNHTAHLHEPNCPKSVEYASVKQDYYRGWDEDEATGRITANCGFSLSYMPKKEPSDEKRQIYGTTKSTGPATDKVNLGLKNLIIRLNISTWNQKYRFVNTLSQFMTSFWIMGGNVDIPKGLGTVTLQNIFLKNKERLDPGELSLNDGRFIYMKFVKCSESKNPENYAVEVLDYKGRSITFYAPKDMFNAQFRQLKDKTSENIMIAGMLRRAYKESRSFVFFSLAMINVSSLGVYAENSAEVALYNRLHEYNIPFIKPDKPSQLKNIYEEYFDENPEWLREHKTSAIMYPDNKKPIIIEIFSDSTEESMKIRALKRKALKEQDKFYYLTWDVYHGESMPDLKKYQRSKKPSVE